LAGLQGALQVKRVNDTLGHWVGDKVIAGIGEVLRLLPAALRNKLTQQVRLQITVSLWLRGNPAMTPRNSWRRPTARCTSPRSAGATGSP
jgi:hypothetical protein